MLADSRLVAFVATTDLARDFYSDVLERCAGSQADGLLVRPLVGRSDLLSLATQLVRQLVQDVQVCGLVRPANSPHLVSVLSRRRPRG
ncbi:MAG: hypothetical protein QOF51_2752 [Chloroflexota bacterium]|jgi:hypothetical protein|nr:hypothetical protein [Chloroflexota bacterium]